LDAEDLHRPRFYHPWSCSSFWSPLGWWLIRTIIQKRLGQCPATTQPSSPLAAKCIDKLQYRHQVFYYACTGAKHIRPIKGTLRRLVESQEEVATLEYVDTLEEQAVLEEMLARHPC